MKKKFIAAVLTALTLTTQIITVSAEEYSSDGTATCQVSATVSSSYSVKLPATLELSYNSTSGKYEGTYKVSAKGNITPDKSVQISPTANSFTLTGSKTGETASAAVSQTVTEWIHESKSEGTGKIHIGTNEYAETSGSVSASLSEADTYTGEFTFTFSLADYAG